MNSLEDCPMPSPEGISGKDSFTHESGALIAGRDSASHAEDQLQVYTYNILMKIIFTLVKGKHISHMYTCDTYTLNMHMC